MIAEFDPFDADPKKDGAKLDGGKIPVYQGVVDYFPRALEAVADISAFGAAKYSWKGWETVPDNFNRYSNAEVRHMLAHARGEVYDKDSGRLHLAHKAWNALANLEKALQEGIALNAKD